MPGLEIGVWGLWLTFSRVRLRFKRVRVRVKG
jgi:hypothetical protein